MSVVYHHDVSERTTITLEDDVAERLHAEVRRTGRPFKAVVNEAIRSGLERAAAPSLPPFRVRARSLGLREGLSYDDIEGLLDAVEGPDRR